MSNFIPSKEQELAIKAEGCNYLISAGAGSGKTAVLTERIYQLVKKTKQIDKFLILTFTKAAASEMKQRIRNLLLEDVETKKFAVEVDNAHIETFDSFYLFLASKYFYKLNIFKDISVIDKAIIVIKRKQIIEQLFKEKIIAEDQDILSLIVKFSLKGYDDLMDLVLKVINQSESHTDKEAYYKHLEEDFKGKDFTDFVIKQKYESLRRRIHFLIEKIKTGPLTSLDDQAMLLDHCYEALNKSDYASLAAYLEVDRLDKRPKDEENILLRDGIKNFYNALREDLPTEDDISKLIEDNAKYAKTILDLVREVEKQIDDYKREHNCFSFADISRMVLKLFKDPEIVNEVKEQFDYIMVDEYQDTNDIQEAVLNIIGKDNVYMVGDIKQSIYRFRDADCHIFEQKFNDYKKGLGGKEVDLNKSFRSREDVVNYINDLFSRIMVKEYNPIDYSNGHKFAFGQTKYGPLNPLYQTEEYHYQYEIASQCAENEIEMITRDIIDKVNNEFPVYDFNLKTTRGAQFKDFAIIIDREGEFYKFRKAFSAKGIPLKSCGKEQLMISDINVVIRNLVKLLSCALAEDYGEEYKHAFLSVSRSFIFESKDQEIFDVYKDNNVPKVLLTPLAQKIELIKESLRFAPLKVVMETLFDTFEIYDHIAKITNFYANTHKAETLLSFASQMDALGLSLNDLVDYFDNLTNLELDIDYRDSDSQENSVTLINIHQSKGLEYNIVYYPLLNKQFNQDSYKGKFTVSKNYGIIFSEDSSLVKSLHNEIEKQQEIEEKIRLLYVAITRAKQKIILYFGHKETKSLNIKMPYECICLKDVYELANIGNKYVKEFKIDENKLKTVSRGNINLQYDKVELKHIEVPSEVIKKERASKEVVKVTSDLLDFGSDVHAILEGLNFDSKDISYIKDKKFIRLANNVLNSSLFAGVKDEQILKEFPFTDEINNVSGVIDCLVNKEDEIDIIDFKLKNISEVAYDKQLRTYKQYVKSISTKPIRMYLLSALTGEIREVEDEQ